MPFQRHDRRDGQAQGVRCRGERFSGRCLDRRGGRLDRANGRGRGGFGGQPCRIAGEFGVVGAEALVLFGRARRVDAEQGRDLVVDLARFPLSLFGVALGNGLLAQFRHRKQARTVARFDKLLVERHGVVVLPGFVHGDGVGEQGLVRLLRRLRLGRFR